MKKWVFLALIAAIGLLLWDVLDRLEGGENVSWPHLLAIGLCLKVASVWGFLTFRALAKARRELSILKDIMTQGAANVGIAHLARELRSSEIELAEVEPPKHDSESGYKLFLEERFEKEQDLLACRDRFERACNLIRKMGLRVIGGHQDYLGSRYEEFPPAA